MNIKEKLSENHFLLFLKMVPYMLSEYWQFSKQTARCQMSKTPDKLLTEILMLTHAIEKGFSIYNKKDGFGISKLQSLMKLINKYINKYGYTDQLNIPLSLVYALIDFHKSKGFNHSILDATQRQVSSLVEQLGKKDSDFCCAGYKEWKKDKMMKVSDMEFYMLANARVSFRHFSSEPVREDELKSALDIARRSPSACNRQSYRVHIYQDKLKDDLLVLQGGAKGFCQEVSKVIIVTSNLNRYYTTEQHLPYIDASLFSMSLLYALTANNIASIPLTLCRKKSIIKEIVRMAKIPSNEVPVIMIAVGHFPEYAEIAMSERNPIDYFTTFHQ